MSIRRVRPALAVHRPLLAAAFVVAAAATPATLAAQRGQTARLDAEQLRPFEFRPIGPANTSGRITAIDAPADEGGRVVYVGTAGGGVWKTTNRGTTWQPLWDDKPFGSVGDLAVAPSDPEQIWVGMGERNSLRSQGWGDGVYRSTDGGRSWTHLGIEDTRQIGRIAVHPNDPNTAYVAALGHLWGAGPDRGVYKTTDGGESWDKVLFVDDTTGFVDLKMDPSDPDVLYAAAWHRLRWGGGRMEGAGAGSGIYRTRDGGRSWTRLTDPRLQNGLPSGAIGRIGLAIYPRDPNIVYAVIQVGRSNRNPSISAHGGVFRSDDAGESWTRVHDISAVPDYYYNEIYVDPNDPDHLWLNGTILMESHDGGRTFDRAPMRNVHVDHHAFWVDPNDSRNIVLGNDGGIYMSHDGGSTWGHENIPVGQFYEVDLDTTKVPYHVCGGLQDNGVWCGPSRTRDRTGITLRDWYPIYGGDGFHSAVAPDDPNFRYAESQFGNIGRTNVRTGETVNIQPQVEDAGPESGYEFRWDWNTPFIISQHDPTVLYVGGNHLFKLTDRGDDWQILGPDMTRQTRTDPAARPAHTSYGALHSIAESPLDARVLWTGSDDGLIWTTTDGGASWTQVTDNIPDREPRECWVSEIEASAHDVRTAYVTFDCHMRDDYRPYVYRTTDGGRSWRNISGDVPDGGATYVVREDPVNSRLLFVGTEQGLYMSNEGGGHWVQMTSGLPTAAVRDMNIALRANELVVGTMGRSVYVRDLTILRDLTPEAMAEPVHLFPVAPARIYNTVSEYESFGDDFYRVPNPSADAEIVYRLREDVGGDVRLSIRRAGETDVVQTLTGSGRPGIHTVTWDLMRREPRLRRLGDPTSPNELRRADPGRYTVELRAGDVTQTQEFTVEQGWYDETVAGSR